MQSGQYFTLFSKSQVKMLHGTGLRQLWWNLYKRWVVLEPLTRNKIVYSSCVKNHVRAGGWWLTLIIVVT
jgi:hypothetical protein